ncbi:MAG: hypothetical protein AAF439_16260, partial [Pseudomonadota bacterium]
RAWPLLYAAGMGEILKHPMRLLSEHWHGRLSLTSTVLFSLITVRVVFDIFHWTLSAAADAPLIALTVLSCLVIPIWQIVGTIRAVARYQAFYGSPILAWGTYFILLVVLAMAATQALSTAARLTAIAGVPYLQAAPPPLPLSDDGTTVRLTGDLTYLAHNSLGVTLESNTAITRVELASGGGLVYAARAIAKTIIERGLNTHVAGTCASACAIAFAAGTQRSLGPEGRLGFHRYAMRSPDAPQIFDIEAELAKDRSYFAARGIDDAFLDRVFRAPHSDIWYPARAELEAAGVLNQAD